MNTPYVSYSDAVPKFAPLYVADFYAWTQVQAQLLKQQQWHQIDGPNLIEEIESLG